MTTTVLTVEDAAGMLGVSDQKIRKLFKTGELKGFKLGGITSPWKTTAAELNAYIERRMAVGV